MGINRRSIAVLLIFSLLLLPLAVSCGKETSRPVKKVEVNLDHARRGDKLDIVPEDVKFDGDTFTILSRTDNDWGNYLYELTSDGEHADAVDLAVKKRNETVENRFGIKLNIFDIPGQWDAKDDFIADFRTSVYSGCGSYDLVMSQQAYMANTSLFELYTNMYDVPYIKDDLTSNYFNRKMIDEISVGGTLYYLVGDYCLSYWEDMYAMYFNKKLAVLNSGEDIYDLVRNGDWTIDKCIELSRGMYRDINENSARDSSDRYGYISDITNTTDAWFSEFDVQATTRTEDGNIRLGIDQSKMVDILEKMINYFGTDDVYSVSTLSSSQKINEQPLDDIFTDGRALFYPATLGHEKNFCRTALDYGFVPYPKWDRTQQDYLTQSQNGYSVAVIPSDVKNIEKSGAVLDVLMAESKRYVTEAFFSDSAISSLLRDEDSIEMLDIIRNGVQVNFGYFYYQELRTGGIIRYLMDNNISYFVSYYAANQRSYEKNLEKILEKCKK